LNRKPGKFDLADGGTLLLDEISEMDVSLQAKLLRALQEGEIDPVGGKGPHKIDARVIATTNRQLKSWVDEGKFRADLYYRLNVMPIYIPGLKDRKDDILPLTRFFMENYSRQNGKTVTDIEPEALEFLMSHDWPGNIRELENTIARAVLMTRGTSIKAEDIFMDETGFMLALERNSRVPETTEPEERPSESPHSAPGEIPRADETPLSEAGFAFQSGSGETSPEEDDVPGESFRAAVAGFPAGSEGMPVMTIEEMERRLIGRALNETSGNRTHAAKLLGISVRTLRNKLNEYRAGQIPEPEAASAMIG
ncbi:MAG: sigma 54-interacting transcriptional regulator, partial [Deltaproteobacteria bacterium]|nr:sigma 54-interacting transcriptional regulator [Deltaproteobacteria bacterium]